MITSLGAVYHIWDDLMSESPLPLLGADTLDLNELDKLLREGNIAAILDITDEVLLRQGVGLSSEDTKMLRTIWQKLRDRRVNRK
jgi:adenine-specific DNA-methyltransferase